MASTYSSNLRLELIATGEQSGTWGATTNTNLGTLLEEAIGGYVSVAVTDGADTVLTTNNGLADQARNMTINLTGTLTAARNVICPAIEKVYLVKNSTTGGFAVTLKVSGQTGVSIPNGATMLVYVDGVDARQAGAIVGASNAVLANSIELGGTTDTTLTRVSAGVAAIEGKNIALNGTGETLTTGSIELGHASDTTITRSAAGVIAVEGGVVPKENRANTFSALQTINASAKIGGATDLTPGTSWDGQITALGNGYSGGISLDATGMWVGNTSAARALLFAINETEKGRFTTSGAFLVGASSTAWNGSLIKAVDTIAIADGSSINLSSSICGGAIVSIYEGNSGNGGLFWINYTTAPVKIAGNGEVTDTGATFAVLKNTSSHVCTLKNRSGLTRNYHVVVIAGNLS